MSRSPRDPDSALAADRVRPSLHDRATLFQHVAASVGLLRRRVASQMRCAQFRDVMLYVVALL